MHNRLCIIVLTAILMFATVLMPFTALAEAAPAAQTNAGLMDADEPFTWTYLATIAGAAAFTLLVVQFIKAPLDAVCRIPTRVLVYIIALAVMLVATAFTVGLTANNALLAAVNAFVSAMTAMGAYELTFAKVDQ